MKKKLSLYVWEDFMLDWSGGLAFAIAGSEEEARELIEVQYGFSPSEWGRLSVHDLVTPYANAVSGGA